MTAEELEKQVMEKEDEIRRQNAWEAAESERLRREEEARLAAELARYDTDYLNDDEPEPVEEPEIRGEMPQDSEPGAREAVSEGGQPGTREDGAEGGEPELRGETEQEQKLQEAPRQMEENEPEGENSADEKEGEQL